MFKKIGTNCLILSCVFWSGCGSDHSPVSSPKRPVHTMRVSSPENSYQRRFSGVLKSSQEVGLSFRLSGKLVELPIKTGMFVKKGEIIASLDATDYHLEIKKLAAQLAQGESQLQKALSDYERTRLLYEADSLSKSVLDRDQAAYLSAKAQVNSMEAQLDIARQKLAYTTLTSPMNGYISSTPVEQFQLVKEGQTITTVSSREAFEIEVGIPESVISLVHVGDPAEILLDVLPEKRFKAVVSEVGVTALATNTFPLVVKITEHDPILRGGMVGEVSLEVNKKTVGDLTVPTTAIVTEAGQNHHVFVYNPKTESVEKRSVKVGRLVAAGVVVKKGLKPGEEIVIRGSNRLEEGMKVKVLSK